MDIKEMLNYGNIEEVIVALELLGLTEYEISIESNEIFFSDISFDSILKPYFEKDNNSTVPFFTRSKRVVLIDIYSHRNLLSKKSN